MFEHNGDMMAQYKAISLINCTIADDEIAAFPLDIAKLKEKGYTPATFPKIKTGYSKLHPFMYILPKSRST